MKTQTIISSSLALFIFGLAAVVIQAAPATQIPLTSPLPIPGRFDSPLPTPIPCPASTKWHSLTIEAKIGGIERGDSVKLSVQPDTPQTAACLAVRGTKLPDLSVRNGDHNVTITDIPDGSYKLTVEAPAEYLRNPWGYLFQMSEGQIIRASARNFNFELIPPADQAIPLCRNLAIQPVASTYDYVAGDIASESRIICKAERLIDISAPPKQVAPRENGVLGEGYHYIGPTTYQDN